MTRHPWHSFVATMASMLVAGSAFTQGSSGSGVPGIADFARSPDFTEVTISPDGKYLAALLPKPNEPHQNQLVLLDAETAKPLRVLNSGAHQLIGNYVWANDNRLIAALAVQLDGLDTPVPTGELYAINASGSRPMTLFGFRAGNDNLNGIGQKQRRDAAATVISTELEDPDHILIATQAFDSSRNGSYTDIEKLDVMSGSTRRLGASPARNAELIADHQGQVRAAFTTDDWITYRLWTRASNDAPWMLTNDPATSNISLLPLGFNRDNSKIYVESTQGDAPDAIELLDMRSGARNKVYQGQFASPLTLLPSMDGKDYYAVVTADGKKNLHYIDSDSAEARLNSDLAKTFVGRLVYLSSFSRDGKRAVVRVESDRNSGDYYLLDLATHQAHYLLSENPRIDPRQLRPMQPIGLKARDGQPLHGFLTVPNGRAPYPFVVMVHGGPFGVADKWEYDAETQLFASRGYAVLRVNFRGSGGYGANFISRGFRQWGQAMQDDLTDATRWAIQQGYATPKRICIYGASYGGYASIEATVREPELYRCAIGYAGVYDMRIQARKSDVQASNAGVSFMQKTMGDDMASLLSHSPLGGVDRIKANLLLIHGGKDRRVPFENFQQFTRALDAQHRTYETLVESEEGHGFYIDAHRVAAYEKMIDFLDRNIGDRSVAPASGTVIASDRHGP